MRIELIFNIEKKIIPSDYRKIFISFLKNAISKCNQGKFYEQYFGDTIQKDYSFTVLLPKPQFRGEEILLESNQIKMIFTASDRNKTDFIFYAAFLHQKNRYFPLPGKNGIILIKVSQKKEIPISGSRALFRTATGGGLVIREHNRETNEDHYYTFEEPEFEFQMKQVLGAQAKAAGFLKEDEDIKLHPLQCKKVVVRHYGIYLDTTVGIFEVEAKPELLKYFYQAGIGSKHSQGFGTIDLIQQN